MKYFIEDYQQGPEDAYTIHKTKSIWGREHPQYVAEDAAEDYHGYHDGWESTWPLIFVILDDELNELGRFSVDRECVPQFHASRV